MKLFKFIILLLLIVVSFVGGAFVSKKYDVKILDSVVNKIDGWVSKDDDTTATNKEKSSIIVDFKNC